MRSPVRSTDLTGASGQHGPQATDQALTYAGFTIRETAGSTAVVVIRGNGVVTGQILDEISLAANESASDEYIEGRYAGSGIYVQVVSGAVAGSIFYE